MPAPGTATHGNVQRDSSDVHVSSYVLLSPWLRDGGRRQGPDLWGKRQMERNSSYVSEHRYKCRGIADLWPHLALRGWHTSHSYEYMTHVVLAKQSSLESCVNDVIMWRALHTHKCLFTAMADSWSSSNEEEHAILLGELAVLQQINDEEENEKLKKRKRWWAVGRRTWWTRRGTRTRSLYAPGVHLPVSAPLPARVGAAVEGVWASGQLDRPSPRVWR